MPIVTWGLLTKSAEDATKIEEEIDARIVTHNADPDAHGLVDMALYAHRSGDVLDHIVEAVRNVKIYRGARAYTVVVEVPTIQTHTLRPNGPGSETNIPNQYPDSGEHWDKVDEEIPDGDATYVEHPGGAAKRDLYAIPSPAFSNPNNKAQNLRVYVSCKAPSGGAQAYIAIKTYGQIYESGDIGVGTGYGYGVKLWQFNPYTNDFWTKEELDALEIGVTLVSVSSFYPVRCSQIYARIDEVTDEGKGDYFNIQKAIDKANELGGGIVFLRPGIYQVYGDLILYNNIALIGFDRESVILNMSGFSIKAIGDTSPYTTGTISVTWQSQTVTGSGTSWLANVTPGEYILIDKVWYKIKSVESNISLTLEDIYRGPSRSGLSYRIANLYHGIELKNFTMLDPVYGVQFRYVIDSFITNLIIKTYYTGIYIGDYCDGILVENNVVRHCEYGIYISYSTHISVRFNDVSNGYLFGIMLSYCSFSEVKANKLFNMDQARLFINRSDYIVVEGNFINRLRVGVGLDFTYSNYCLVTNNTITNVPLHGIGLYDTSVGNVILGNISSNNGGYGIRIASASVDRTLVLGNVLRNNTSGAIQNLGVNTEIGHNITE